MDRISSYLLLGFEGTVDDLLIPFGLSGNAVPVTTGDTHDGGIDDRAHSEAVSKRDAEARRKREELRAQLLAAVERVTGKPPPLDQSLKQLAATARKSEGFDYQAVLRDIEAIERMRTDDALSGAREIERRRELEQQQIDNANAAKILLLMAIL